MLCLITDISLLTAFYKVLRKLYVGYNNNFISNSTSTKFLAVIIENTLSWKAHIDHLLPKLYLACYGVRTIKSFLCQENLSQYIIPTFIP